MESVTKVVPQDDYHLLVSFNTGETKLFDARPYLDKGVFTQLKNQELFKQAYVAYDTVCWPGNLDIAPETLYDRSTALGEGNHDK
ncbi:MAG: hypothetical protein A2075_19155 [Geobacteraceae bacterium GWC2_58_44]|nr:MAG: hypothetical protein A2075_19155 [Geobacteraceae bacterium GWC2_58_44]HBG05781.1 DUF2442 domain-containing protein [Geobacter sp.]